MLISESFLSDRAASYCGIVILQQVVAKFADLVV